MTVVISFVIAYLIGGLNFSILTSKLLKREDVRDSGSGNAGFTNTLRSYGKGLAAVVLLCDVLKTVLAAYVAHKLAQTPGVGYWHALVGRTLCASNPLVLYAAGLGVILGHNFPLFYGFKGGKGILATVAIMVIVDWRMGLLSIPVGVAIMFLTGYVSLGSLVLCLWFPGAMMLLHWGNVWLIVFAWMVCISGFFMHRGNIRRLLSGTERRFGKRGRTNQDG